MEIKNRLVMRLDATCARLRGMPEVNEKTKVAWAIMRNAAGVVSPIADLKKALEPTGSMKKVEAGRQELIKTYATKGPDGTPIADPMPGRPGMVTYRIEDTAAFTAAFEALVAQHPQVREDEMTLAKREAELMEETIEFTPYVLHIADVPDGVLDVEAMEVLHACGILID